MKKASITEAKNSLSALIDGLKNGSAVLIVDRGRPVARLAPVAGNEGEDEGRLSRLLRDGIIRARRGHPSLASFTTQPRHTNSGASVVEALITERREGR